MKALQRRMVLREQSANCKPTVWAVCDAMYWLVNASASVRKRVTRVKPILTAALPHVVMAHVCAMTKVPPARGVMNAVMAVVRVLVAAAVNQVLTVRLQISAAVDSVTPPLVLHTPHSSKQTQQQHLQLQRVQRKMKAVKPTKNLRPNQQLQRKRKTNQKQKPPQNPLQPLPPHPLRPLKRWLLRVNSAAVISGRNALIKRRAVSRITVRMHSVCVHSKLKSSNAMQLHSALNRTLQYTRASAIIM